MKTCEAPEEHYWRRAFEEIDVRGRTHAIDGFWVQRQISEIYPDPVTAADKAPSVINILDSDSSVRDCENQLMELFDYESYHVVAKFLMSREVIVCCTKLMRSDADERVNVEVAKRVLGGFFVSWLAIDKLWQ